MKQIDTFVPVFPGFYNTVFDRYTDGEDERELVLDHLCRDGEVIDASSQQYDIDWSRYREDYAREITCAVDKMIKSLELPGYDRMEYQALRSPREYNFANDSINCIIHLTDEPLFRKSLVERLKADPEFKEFIRKRYTSYDGFISWYSNDHETWLADIASGENDVHGIGTVLEFLLRQKFGDDADTHLCYETDSPWLGEYITWEDKTE